MQHSCDPGLRLWNHGFLWKQIKYKGSKHNHVQIIFLGGGRGDCNNQYTALLFNFKSLHDFMKELSYVLVFSQFFLTNRLNVLCKVLLSPPVFFFVSPGYFTLSRPQNPQNTEVAGTTGHIGTMFHEIRNELHPQVAKGHDTAPSHPNGRGKQVAKRLQAGVHITRAGDLCPRLCFHN